MDDALDLFADVLILILLEGTLLERACTTH